MDMAEKGYPMKLVEGYRTPERQAELYAQGRTKPGKVVTNARAGESFHNYGVAADCVFVKEGYNAPERLWQIYGNVAARHGFTWGGVWDLKDYPHIEMTKGYSFTDFQQGRVDISKFD
jgi:peptidoglycan L-alanyl-D-glutamate endopeptidase CwlK